MASREQFEKWQLLHGNDVTRDIGANHRKPLQSVAYSVALSKAQQTYSTAESQ